jgi:hypothetical protein
MNLAGNVSAGYSTLNHSLKVLRVLWDETQVEWNDPVGRSFHETHWEPLEARVAATLRAMDRMIPTLASMQRDCE